MGEMSHDSAGFLSEEIKLPKVETGGICLDEKDL
jgi:hypothetical protein